MFYYQHHIGDYRRDTGHLSLLEHGIYRQLLDHYYITEKPLDANAMRLVCVRTAEEEQAYKRVLADFFHEQKGKYFHKRCHFEISKYKDKSGKATDSAKKRWNKKKDIDDAKALPPHMYIDADGMPTKEPINLITGEPNKSKEPLKPIDPKTKKKDRPLADMPEGFNKDIWDDFQVIRKAKAAPLTKTGLNGIAKQAGLAGISLEAALQECCTRNWQSFRADWINKPQQGTQSGKFNAGKYIRDQLAMESQLAEKVVGSGVAQEIGDGVSDQIPF